MSPLILTVLIAAVACAFAWFASLVTGDTSWVDRMWSIVPVIYVWVFAGAAHLHDARLDVMAALVSVWGVRLTYNFARKGGYSGVEDYRWAVLRSSMQPWQFQLFNLFFIVLYQNALLVLIALPAWTVSQHRATSFGAVDYLLTVLFLVFTVGETVADQQQWNFHQWKQAEVEAGRDAESSFLATGTLSLLAPPELLLRTRAVVGDLPLRRGRRAVGSGVDHRRTVPLDVAIRRVDEVHREDLAVALPRVRTLSTFDVGGDSVVRSQRHGRAGPGQLARDGPKVAKALHYAFIVRPQKIILYYGFTPLDDADAIRLWQRTLCEQLSLKGRILISRHGINGTLGGDLDDLRRYVAATQ